MSCLCGWQRPAGGSTPSHPVYQLGAWLGLSRRLINPGAYYQNIKLNESLPTSRLHVGGARLLLYAPAWAHICHQSYQLGRGTTSPLSLLAFSIALKWRCISVPQCSCALWGGIVKTPVCSWSTSHPPNIVPPHDFKGQSLTQRLWLPTPYPIFECPSIFTSHLIVQLEKHLFGSSLLGVPTPERPWILSASLNVWCPRCHIHLGPQMGRKTLLSVSYMPGTFLTKSHLLFLITSEGKWYYACLTGERIKNLRPTGSKSYRKWQNPDSNPDMWPPTELLPGHGFFHHTLPSPYKEIKSPFLTWEGPSVLVWPALVDH